MKVILATWYDDLNQPFIYEFFNENIDEEQIFDFYVRQKQVFKRQVIAAYDDTRVFSDGSRVRLTLNTVQQKIEEEGVIDVDSF